MIQSFRFRYLSIILIGFIAGILVTSLAWLQFWTPLRAPRSLYLVIFWMGIICVIAYGFYLRFRHKFLSRLWIGLSIFTAIGLAYLFPDTLAPGCGGMPRVFAHWESQCETVCTTVCTWWVPLSDPECAAQPHQPWDVGCCWAYGEECHEECSSVWVDDPPTVDGSFTCTTPGNGSWCRGGASVDVTATDPQSYPLTIYLDINGSLYSCSGTTCSLPIGDGTGTASFLAQATGGGNLISDISSVTFQVDTQAPTLGVSAPPVDGLNGWYISAPMTVTGTASDSVSGVAWIDINGRGSGYTASADGVYTLTVSAGDAAGNTASGTAYLQIDTTAPGVGFIMPTPNGANGWYRSPITIGPSSSDAMSGVSDQVVSLDGITWYSSTGINSDGTYTVFAAALDLAGNSASTSTTVQYDSTAPDLVVTLPPPNGAGWYTAAPVTITASAGDATSGLGSDAVQYSIDGGTWQAGTSAVITSEGVHSVAFQATDIAGNVTSETHTLNIDTQGALLSLSGNGVFCPACGETLALTYSIQDGGSGIAQWQLSADSLSLANGTAEANSVLTWDGSGLPVGAHTITLLAEDLAGNTVQTSLNVTLQAAPVTATGTPVTGGPGIVTSATHTRTPTSTSTHAATRTPQPTSGSGAGGTVGGGNGTSSGIPSTNTSPAAPVLPWAVAASAVAVTAAATVYTRKREGEEKEIARNPGFTDGIEEPEGYPSDLTERRNTGISSTGDALVTGGLLLNDTIDRNDYLDSVINLFEDNQFISHQTGEVITVTPRPGTGLLQMQLNNANRHAAHMDESRFAEHVDDVMAGNIVGTVQNTQGTSSQRSLVSEIEDSLLEAETTIAEHAGDTATVSVLRRNSFLRSLDNILGGGSLLSGLAALGGGLVYALTGNQVAENVSDIGTGVNSFIDIAEAGVAIFRQSSSTLNSATSTLGRVASGLSVAARVVGGAASIIGGVVGVISGFQEIREARESGDARQQATGVIDTISSIFTIIGGGALFFPGGQLLSIICFGVSGLLTLFSLGIENNDATWNTFSHVMDWIRETAASSSNFVTNAVNDASNWTRNTLSSIVNNTNNAINSASTWTRNAIANTINSVNNGLNSASTWSRNTLASVLNSTNNAIHTASTWSRNAITSVLNSTNNIINSASTWSRNTISSIYNTTTNVITSTSNWISNTVSSVAGTINNIANNLSSTANNLISQLFHSTQTTNSSNPMNTTNQNRSNLTSANKTIRRTITDNTNNNDNNPKIINSSHLE